MKQWLIVGAVFLASCATTTNKRRVVTVNSPPPVQASTVSYDGPEAVAACDTRRMRRAALDNNLNNDLASIIVEREIRPGVRTLTDVDINCREYFAAKLGGGEPTTIAQPAAIDPAPQIIDAAAPRAIANACPGSGRARCARDAATPRSRDTDSNASAAIALLSGPVGDTLYSIGRRHCTGWQEIAAENGLPDSRIDVGALFSYARWFVLT